MRIKGYGCDLTYLDKALPLVNSIATNDPIVQQTSHLSVGVDIIGSDGQCHVKCICII